MNDEITVNPDDLSDAVDVAKDAVGALNRWSAEYDKLRRCGELLAQFSNSLERHFTTLEKLDEQIELAFAQAQSRNEWFSGSSEYRELREKADKEMNELYNDADMFNIEFAECASVYELASKTAYAKLRAAANSLFDAFPGE